MDNEKNSSTPTTSSNMILRYPLNGRSSYLIDKFYIFGYDYMTLKKYFYNDKNIKTLINDNEKRGFPGPLFSFLHELYLTNGIIYCIVKMYRYANVCQKNERGIYYEVKKTDGGSSSTGYYCRNVFSLSCCSREAAHS